ncbi:MAG: HAMP domain-containing histidine kinase [Dorea sp.]|jgi:Signal transduction histidine kinase|uniref:sensor histidine kinase n=1 Tax=Sporofaciens musculi TaxID=2681861 RepID=UPI002170BCB8|nr:HAMP domain-containing sensor histidine kinase [Sporofaciens musculi]MCI9421556.1 HAMP domain-containing histidine kinase [Dorea sp.]
MKSIPKLIRRFLAILLLSIILLFFLNIIILITLSLQQTPGASAWTTAMETGAALQKQDTGDGYILAEEAALELEREHVWGILIDNRTHKVSWHTEHLPEDIPLEYSLSDIASLTRGYLMDYPTFPGESADGLVVLGYPKDRYWKHMYPNWDYDFIANLPKYMLNVLIVNGGLIFLIYFIANMKLLRSVKPIAEGIQKLPTKEPVCVKEKGLLSELAANINQTSEILEFQNYQLKKKETARANWIAGVSHDIRTPLSMVMGYAGQLENSSRLTADERQKVSVILQQSERMRNLINDLNLASKLEYDMQPIHCTQENAVAIARQVVVDFINIDVDGRYPIEWVTEPQVTVCPVNVDKELLKRAVSNLIQNCINHNEDGCTVYVSVHKDCAAQNLPQSSGFVKSEDSGLQDYYVLRVEDDGRGMSADELKRLNDTPHYMMCDSEISKQRHGLGLLIVRKIAQSHGGSIVMSQSVYGGLCVEIRLPAYYLE